MLTHIELKNFKCFREVSVDPKRITVFIGPNGSGKSSFLQALVLLKQSVGQPHIRPEGPEVNLGSIQDLFPRQNSSLDTIGVHLDGSRILDRQSESGLGAEIGFSYGASISREGGVQSYEGGMVFAIDGDRFQVWAADGAVRHPQEIQIAGTTFTLVPSTNIANPVGFRVARGGPGHKVEKALTTALDALRLSLLEMVWVPATRGLFRPLYQLVDEFKPTISPAQGMDSFCQQVATNLEYQGEEIQQGISDLMEKVTGVTVSTRTVPGRQVQVNAFRPKTGKVNIVNEGFGTNQLVILLERLISSGMYATVLIEEPEIHLHPKAQAELASVLVEVAKKEDKQIIFATHSEHMLHRLLTLVASKKLSPEDLAVYAFELREDGIATAQPLEVDERGRIKGGLKGFFEVELEELDQYMKALGQWKAGSAKSSS